MPTTAAGFAGFEAYLERLFELSEVFLLPESTVVASASTAQLLIDIGQYPFRPRIDELIRDHGIVAVTAHDVVVLTDRLLATSLEDEVGIADLLLEEFEFSLDLVELRDGASLVGDSARVIALLALASICDESRGIALVAEGPYAKGTATFTLHVIDALPANCERIGVLPRGVHAPCAVASDFAGVRSWFDVEALWRAAEDEDAAKSVLMLAVQRAADAAQEELGAVSIALHPAFLASVEAHGFIRQEDRARRLIATIVDLLLGRNLRATHALRENAGGNAPAVMRGDDAAWRADIDYEYHLHYWCRADGVLELSCVVTHNDFRIHR